MCWRANDDQKRTTTRKHINEWIKRSMNNIFFCWLCTWFQCVIIARQFLLLRKRSNDLFPLLCTASLNRISCEAKWATIKQIMIMNRTHTPPHSQSNLCFAVLFYFGSISITVVSDEQICCCAFWQCWVDVRWDWTVQFNRNGARQWRQWRSHHITNCKSSTGQNLRIDTRCSHTCAVAACLARLRLSAQLN